MVRTTSAHAALRAIAHLLQDLHARKKIPTGIAT